MSSPLRPSLVNNVMSLNNYCASVVKGDLADRFFLNHLKEKTDFLDRASVSLELTLPFQNDLSKFKNKVHFLLYLLVLETVTGQRAVINSTITRNQQTITNKRALKKAQETIRISSYRFEVLVSNSKRLAVLLAFLSFFATPYTDPQKTVPSRLVNVEVETSSNAVVFLASSLKSIPVGFLVDDLSALRLRLRVGLFPWFNVCQTSPLSRHEETLRTRLLRYVAAGLGVSTSGLFDRPVVNLRLRLPCY
jgi:hypothetical protein